MTSINEANEEISSSNWHYIDDDGNIQGPFSFSEMVAWFDAKYFTPDTKCRKTASNKNVDEILTIETFRPMREIFPPARKLSEQKEEKAAAGNNSDRLSNSNNSNQNEKIDEKKTASEAAESSELNDSSEDYSDSDDDADNNENIDHKKPEQQQSSAAPSTPLPAVPRPGEHCWFYLDDNSELQGPFSTSLMRSWFHAGYFTPSTRVRRDDEPELMELENRPHTEFANHSNNIDTAPPVLSPFTVDDGWYYVDNANIERGPFSTSQFRFWHHRGYLTFNDTKFRRANQNRSESATLKNTFNTPPFLLTEEAAALINEKWFYLDASNNEQGPFNSTQMAQWWKSNLLPKDLSVRLNNEKEFQKVNQRKTGACSFTKQTQESPQQSQSQSQSQSQAYQQYQQYYEQYSPSYSHYQSIINNNNNSNSFQSAPVFTLGVTNRGAVALRQSNSGHQNKNSWSHPSPMTDKRARHSR